MGTRIRLQIATAPYSAKMKVISFFFLAIATVCAKRELSIKNICDNPFIKVTGITDSKSGPVTANSHITIHVDTAADTAASEPFWLVATLALSKKTFIGYVRLPQFLMDKLGVALQKRFPTKLTYLKRSQFRIECPLKEFTGHCLTQKGHSSFTLPMKDIMEEVKAHVGSKANGYVKVEFKSKAPRVPVSKALCFALEAKLQV